MHKIIITVFALVCMVTANAQVANKTTTTRTSTEKTTNVQSSTTTPEVRTEQPSNNTNGTTDGTLTNPTQQQPVKKKIVKISAKRLNETNAAPIEKKSTGNVSSTDKKPD